MTGPQTEGLDELYRRLLAERQAIVDARDRTHRMVGNVRIALAAASVAIVVLGGLQALAWLLVPIGASVVAAFVHGRVLKARDRARSAVAFFERGRARLAHQWAGRGRTGVEFAPAEHLFANDLDLFGRGSLFELLATTRTRAGEETLARWMLGPAEPAEILARQDAVRDLSRRLDLRERVAVLGDELDVRVDPTALRDWARAPVRLRGTSVRVALAALGVASTSLLGWWIWTGGLSGLTLAVLLVQLAVAQWFKPRVEEVVHAVDAPAHDLALFRDLLATVEGEAFTAPYLLALQRDLGTGHDAASVHIARLTVLVDRLSSRRNIIFAPIAALWLWATHGAFAIDAWRARSGARIDRWLDVVGQFEALLALATLAAERPDFAFPRIVTAPPRVDGRQLAHPALGPEAVANDLVLGADAPHLVVVSGSNMSGKSTWLRTIGANLVLAYMGAPVRAAQLTVSPLLIGASISVQDSLTDGRSRFFAEITRLKAIVDAARERGGAVLFLLDEILAGTNSHDRRVGAEALLAGLVGGGAVGLVTTHDLALAAIVDRLPEPAINVHFEDQFVDGTLTFDYRLREGLVRTSNAIPLMRSIGLDV